MSFLKKLISLAKPATASRSRPSKSTSGPSTPAPAQPLHATSTKAYEYSDNVDLLKLAGLCHARFGDLPRGFQLQGAEATLNGKDCVLNIPTGGGKTRAFTLPLLWKEGVVLVISPLIALMKDQVIGLNAKGISAVAVIKETLAADRDLLKAVASGQISMVFVSPELALSERFHREVLSKPSFANALINLVIDEGHCVTEWGGSFRSDYATLGLLRGKIRSGLPVTIASATLPEEINMDLKEKFRLSKDAVIIEMSNNRPNVALSVRPFTHPADTYADLAALIPPGTTEAQHIPAQIVYFNTRIETEDATDKLRAMLPTKELRESDCVAFYHARIGAKRKRELEEKLISGEVRILCCTDAVGMGCDMKGIFRVVLWKIPPTFCALAQRSGRAARNLSTLGEAILFVPKSVYTGTESPDIPVDTEAVVVEDDLQVVEGEQTAGAAVAIEEEASGVSDVATRIPNVGRRTKAKKSALQIRDAEALKEYVSTTGCRRKVWNAFFGNERKAILDVPTPPGARCCDRCEPRLFPIEKITLTKAAGALKTGKRKHFMVDVRTTIRQRLVDWRDRLLDREYPGCGFSVTAPTLLSDHNLDILADCATPIKTLSDLSGRIRWIWLEKWGPELLEELARIYASIDFTTAVQPPPPKKARVDSLAAQLLAGSDDDGDDSMASNADQGGNSLRGQSSAVTRGGRAGSRLGTKTKRSTSAAKAASTTASRRGTKGNKRGRGAGQSRRGKDSGGTNTRRSGGSQRASA